MEGAFTRRDLAGGVRVFHAPSRKFKTVTVRCYLHAPLAAAEVTRTAVVPHVLARGSRRWPSLGELARRCEELYGASLTAGVAKVGEAQSVYVGVEVVEDRYLPAGAGAVAGALELLRALLLEPARDGDGLLRAAVVTQEKANLAHRIQALVNDKVRYASLRCVEEMCRGEPYALHAYGRLEDIPAVDAPAVTRRYEELVAHAPVDVFVVGGEPGLGDEVAAAFDRGPRQAWPLPATQPGRAPEQPRRVVERQAVDQGKLCLGYRTPVRLGDRRYPAMVVYNGVLGGFPHSKLFRNVRERASLAYYASSRYEALKGIVLVAAGIDVARFGDALAIIEAQVADLAAGRITADEFAATQSGLRNRLRSAQDAPGSLIELGLEEAMTGTPRSLAERLDELAAVTPDDVAAVAGQVRLDTVYFLTGEASGEGRPA
jgi:predicted Zn-dependent peptidase